ncbi:hypothetical protein [Conyzicola sp.]|uniref:hypothetical protein n=1 Tax=Conyzicola sp. TaxID=1969404 RepID=UPI0039899E61
MQFVIRHRLLVAIIGSSLALSVFAAVGIYGLLRGPDPTSRPEHRTNPGPASSWSPVAGGQEVSGRPQPVPHTPEAERFVHAVARSLFEWDTRGDNGPSDWAQPLVNVAAPDEAPAVASDVRSYLPNDEIWSRLSTYGARQWLDISSVTVPETWPAALAQATSGQIPPYAVAFTVAGTRHRSGSWGSEPVRSERPVTFTVFAVCPPAEICTLLRLSQLGKPLK